MATKKAAKKAPAKKAAKKGRKEEVVAATNQKATLRGTQKRPPQCFAE